jgi:hypothetical protein
MHATDTLALQGIGYESAHSPDECQVRDADA